MVNGLGEKSKSSSTISWLHLFAGNESSMKFPGPPDMESRSLREELFTMPKLLIAKEEEAGS